MKIAVCKSIVNMDMVTKVAKDLWPWEIDVLEAKYGDGTVQVIDKTAEVERENLPDAAEEFARLANMYGSDGSGTAYVELAYGRGKAGVKALASVIEPPKPKAKRKAAKKTAAKKPPPPEIDGGDGDPLAT